MNTPSLCFRYLIASVLLFHTAYGCVPTIYVSPRDQATSISQCRPIPGTRNAFRNESAVSQIGVPHDAMANVASLSLDAQRTAAAIGILDLIAAWPALDKDADGERRALNLVSLRQELARRIALVAGDVMNTMAAIGCESARSDHAGDAVGEAHQEISEQALFVVFVSDIWIGIISGALLLSGHSLAAAANQVFGGVTATTFGSAETVLHVDQDFRHPQNVLRELWEGPQDSQLFPASVWRFLNSPAEEDPQRTVREALLDRWQTEGRIRDAPGESRALLLSDGGRYTQRDLRVRAEMLRQLGSEVLRLWLAIHRLKYELVQWFDALPLVLSATHPGSELIGKVGGEVRVGSCIVHCERRFDSRRDRNMQMEWAKPLAS